MLLPICTLILLTVPSTSAHSPPKDPFCTSSISLRYPPILLPQDQQQQNPSNWTAPPYAWTFGNWKITHSSRSSYQAFHNFQLDVYPVLPTNQTSTALRRLIDLTSLQFAKTGNTTIDNAIITAFGYDVPLPQHGPDVYNFTGTGTLSSTTNDYMILAWGYDSEGTAYRVDYETQILGPQAAGGEPCINVLSRSETGPSNKTYARLVKEMERVFEGNADLEDYVANCTRLVVDGRRTGEGPVACDEACLMN